MNLATYVITDPNKIPTPAIVEDLYDSVLEAQLIPANVRLALMSTPLEKKWVTIVAYKSMIDNVKGTAGDTSSYGNKDKLLLKTLRNIHKRPDINALLGIKSRLNTGNKSWMEGFIADNGISVLLSAMERRLNQVPLCELDAAVLYELISCLNPIMNNGLTMKIFLSTRRAIRLITQCLIFQWKSLAVAVLEILSVICDYSNDAAFYVVKYFRNISKSRRESPFKYLVDALLTEDVEIKTGILLLMNQVIAAIDDLDKRMILRSELKVVQFGIVCDETYRELLVELQEMKAAAAAAAASAAPIGMTGTSTTPDSPTSRPTSPETVTTSTTSMSKKRKKRITLTTEQRDDHNIAKNYAAALGIELHDDDDDEGGGGVGGGDDDGPQYADDGMTPICPIEGSMAGVCISGKNRGKVSKSILKEFGNKSTKDRWYILSGDRLTWWGTDIREPIAEKGHLDVSEILHIRPYSTNPELLNTSNNTTAPTIFSFEVETKERIYSFGCFNEPDKESWITALYIARDKAVLKKYSYHFNIESTMDAGQFESLLQLYKKQIVVYDVLATEDYEQCITSGNINLSDPSDMIKYLHYETSIAGLNDKFMKVLQEFIIVPSDTKFGDLFWDKILLVCRDLRSLMTNQDYGLMSTSGGASSTSVMKDYSLTSYELDLESCIRILKKKDQSSMGQKINEVNRLTVELFTKKEEIERLQQEIKILRGNGSSSRRPSIIFPSTPTHTERTAAIAASSTPVSKEIDFGARRGSCECCSLNPFPSLLISLSLSLSLSLSC
jgi:hypothetical protein